MTIQVSKALLEPMCQIVLGWGPLSKLPGGKADTVIVSGVEPVIHKREPPDVIHLSSDEDDCVRPARQPSEIRRRVQISIETSFTIRPDKTRLEDGTYDFVYPRLRRKACGHP